MVAHNSKSDLPLGETSISNEKKILSNFACTESNKSQIIAFGIGTSSIALVSKLDVEHEHIESKFGNINDLMANKLKHLMILTSRGHVLVYDTSIGCQLLKTHVLDSHPIAVKFLHENTRYFLQIFIYLNDIPVIISS